ncbi:hypothetical protein ACOMHN_062201 [Nucella lapillus]
MLQTGPSSTSSTGVPQPQAGPSSSSTSPHSVGLGQFFLQQVLQSQSTSATRGRSARVQRYRYGESLTEEETINKLRKSQAGDKRKGKGKGKGKGKKTPQSESRSRSRSPISEKSDEGQAVCRRCGEPDGLNWVQCDICDEWFHIACTNITDSIDDLEDVQWICDFCCQ